MKLIYNFPKNILPWLVLFFIIFFIKGAIFFIDSYPMFFLGDSQSYISTAINGWIPPDRSFVYGFFIRLIAISTHSLKVLLATQVLISCFTALITAYLLNRFFFVRKKLSFFISVIICFDPLQLFYERYVLTETLSLFIFSIYFIVLFRYLESPKIYLIIATQIIGTVLISLRLSFLPIIIFNSVFSPLLSVYNFRLKTNYKSIHEKSSLKFRTFDGRNKKLSVAILHIIISATVMYCFHFAYKNLNGFLSKRPPAYQYHSGFFLLADLAPIIKVEDFPSPEIGSAIFDNIQFDLLDRKTRGPQRWMEGGLIANLLKVFPDDIEADRVAKQIAINAIKRDPISALKLSFKGFLDYWDKETLEKCLKIDRGSDRNLPIEMVETLKKKFQLNAESFPTLKTFTNVYYFSVWPWYLFLMCTPFLGLFIMFYCDQKVFNKLLILLISIFILVIIASTLIERPTIRYFHPIGWLFIFFPSALIEQLLSKSLHRN
jgi:hypothetical protein